MKGERLDMVRESWLLSSEEKIEMGFDTRTGFQVRI